MVNAKKKRYISYLSVVVLGAAWATSTQCVSAPFVWHETPPGYVLADGNNDDEHYKTRHDTGLRVTTFDNPKGGTASFWSADLVEKLQTRGYVLTTTLPVESRNNVHGTRFDFDYRPDPQRPNEAWFYSAVLFVTDDYRVVVQLAGNFDQREPARQELSTILAELRIGGCDLGSDVCHEVVQPNAAARSTVP